MARDEERMLLLDRVGEVVVTILHDGIYCTPLDSVSVTTSCFGLINYPKTETKIKFSDIYAIEQIDSSFVQNPSNDGTSLQYTEMHRFVIHGVIRLKSQPWILTEYIFGHKDLTTCQLWIERINACLTNQNGRPKNLLVLVHPLCGKRKGIKTWETVAPLFRRAKVERKVMVTERAGHAYDLILSLSDRELRSFDGIVTVGGDGVFNEVLNALLSSRHKIPLPSPPIESSQNKELIINKNGDDTCRVTSSADVSEVSPETSCSEPLLSDSLSNGTHFSKFRMENGSNDSDEVPSVSFPNDWLRLGLIPAGSTDAIVLSTTGVRDPVTSAMHIILGNRIPLDIARVVRWKTSISSVMNSPTIHYAASFLGYGFYGDVIKESEKYRWMGPSRYDFAGTKVFLQHKSYEVEVNYIETKTDSSSESSRSKQICRTNCSVCNNQSDDRSDIKWKRIKGKCISVGGAVISCRNERAPDGLVSDAHLSDGLLDLIFIQDCPPPHYLWHLTQLTRKGSDPLNYSFIEHHKTPQFTFISQHDKGLWNLDGEMFKACQVSVQACRGLVNLFASGPEV
ncbi:hypothetical protein LUZ60_016864 [Juncus effusus]|nr:hypothetical protein LUZ60_016864 [Juncus effusus]